MVNPGQQYFGLELTVGDHQLELCRPGRHSHQRLQQDHVALGLHDGIGDVLKHKLLAAPKRLKEDVHVCESGSSHALQLGWLEADMALGAAAEVQRDTGLAAAPRREAGEEGGSRTLQLRVDCRNISLMAGQGKHLQGGGH